jgi:D-alanyl-D-alanine carboxypeptidase (penicillin-binding protein 5/6)
MMKVLMRIVRKRRRWPYILSVLVILAAYAAWCLLRPLPLLQAVPSSPHPAPVAGVNLAWPGTGQAAVGILGSPILESHGPETPLPTASTAKLITALTILQQKPMTGQAGPTLTLSSQDVNFYNYYVAHGGSVVPVANGEKINEYQLLQAILLPSANNMADSMAIWAFGSMPAYTTAAQAYLAAHGLKDTRVGTDASGYAPSTTSTARDLVRIGELAMQNPVISQIVSQSAATLPVGGTVRNVNWLLGTANIVGVKTGNTDQAGGVFVAASRITVNKQPLTVVTTVLGAPTLAAAMKNTLALMQSAQANFPTVNLILPGQQAGRYNVPWQNGPVAVITASKLSLQVWNGDSWTITDDLKPLPAAGPPPVSTIDATANNLPSHYKVSLKLQDSIPPPSMWWRLKHPVN